MPGKRKVNPQGASAQAVTQVRQALASCKRSRLSCGERINSIGLVLHFDRRGVAVWDLRKNLMYLCRIEPMSMSMSMSLSIRRIFIYRLVGVRAKQLQRAGARAIFSAHSV